MSERGRLVEGVGGGLGNWGRVWEGDWGIGGGGIGGGGWKGGLGE